MIGDKAAVAMRRNQVAGYTQRESNIDDIVAVLAFGLFELGSGCKAAFLCLRFPESDAVIIRARCPY